MSMKGVAAMSFKQILSQPMLICDPYGRCCASAFKDVDRGVCCASDERMTEVGNIWSCPKKYKKLVQLQKEDKNL